MPLDLVRLRLEFVAADPIYFPPDKASNTLRGALLTKLPPDESRAFVFRARPLNGRYFQPGETFRFDLHLFAPIEEAIATAFRSLAREGFGPSRSSARLERTTSQQISLNLSPVADAPREIRVDFLSPTEMKHHHTMPAKPEYPILFAAIRRRIGALCSEPLPALSDNHDRVLMTSCELHRNHIERRSSRTGQVHSIGGFTGFAVYHGDLAEFLPLLRAAQWTGVGRHVVWGNGEIAVTES